MAAGTETPLEAVLADGVRLNPQDTLKYSLDRAREIHNGLLAGGQ